MNKAVRVWRPGGFLFDERELSKPIVDIGTNEQNEQGNYMAIEEQTMELREKQAFWSGVVRGVIGSAVFFAGLVTLIYYIVQIVRAIG